MFVQTHISSLETSDGILDFLMEEKKSEIQIDVLKQGNLIEIKKHRCLSWGTENNALRELLIRHLCIGESM